MGGVQHIIICQTNSYNFTWYYLKYNHKKIYYIQPYKYNRTKFSSFCVNLINKWINNRNHIQMLIWTLLDVVKPSRIKVVLAILMQTSTFFSNHMIFKINKSIKLQLDLRINNTYFLYIPYTSSWNFFAIYYRF